ncbi:HPF/RaiA family ribosome-associated protein [candidate division GN15 bacterium]|nr:HPF/RaiA family ribosome-associated protein [candidate division GN15 bacterium]
MPVGVDASTASVGHGGDSMQVPLELSFRDVAKSPDIEALIHEKVGKLEQVCDYITSCRVSVERPQRHQQSGNLHRVRIEVRVPPGHELVVTKEPGEADMHAPLSGVIRDAFDAARRRLKELVERQRDETKSHPQQEVTAIISEIDVDGGYGFLETVDGRRIYFHRNSVVNEAFEDLDVGNGVRYVEEQGDKGPKATTVQVLQRRSTGET